MSWHPSAIVHRTRLWLEQGSRQAAHRYDDAPDQLPDEGGGVALLEEQDRCCGDQRHAHMHAPWEAAPGNRHASPCLGVLRSRALALALLLPVLPQLQRKARHQVSTQHISHPQTAAVASLDCIRHAELILAFAIPATSDHASLVTLRAAALTCRSCSAHSKAQQRRAASHDLSAPSFLTHLQACCDMKPVVTAVAAIESGQLLAVSAIGSSSCCRCLWSPCL